MLPYTLCIFMFLLITFVECNDILELSNDDVLNKEEVEPIAHIIEDLNSKNWNEIVNQLEYIADQPTSKISSIAHSALGDFWSGIAPISGSWVPPLIDLRKAFKHYTKAVEYPFPDIAKAHYMISFIALHHPTFVTENYQAKFKAISDKMTVLPDNMDPIHKDETTELQQQQQQQQEDSHMKNDDIDIERTSPKNNEIILPNVPLCLLHQSFAAKGNYTPALLSLGYKLTHGHYTPVSCTKSIDLYRNAAQKVVSTIKQNRPQIKLSTDSVRLDEEYASGKSVLRDETDIVEYYRYAADTGDVESQLAMGIIYLEGGIGGLTRDYERAYYYFQLGAEAGDSMAMSSLAFMHQMGYGTEPDNDTALSLYMKAAKLGSANAMSRLGVSYYYGWGVEKNIEEARRWFEKAKEKNDPEAFMYLGRMAFAGLGIPKSYTLARVYFQKAAQGGHLVSLYNLGTINADGLGVRPSCTNAVALYTKIMELSFLKNASTTAYRLYAQGYHDRALVHYELAADQGDLLAQLNAAWLYQEGFGVDTLGGPLGPILPKKDRLQKALRYYLLAAQQNSDVAHLRVGDYYFYGWGISNPNLEIASNYYRVASNLRNTQATFNLGYMHHYGIGLPKDIHLAKRFYDMAKEISPEAYYPCNIMLGTLAVEQFVEHVLAGGLVFGYLWDSFAIILLSLCLLVVLVVRQAVIWDQI